MPTPSPTTIGPQVGSVPADVPEVGGRSALVQQRVILALVLLGVVLRAWNYLANPSLFLDEILLARNIIELPLSELLTKPLALDQVAPRGFLLVEKLLVSLFGTSEYVLRFFPFACSIAALFLFRRLAQRTLAGYALPLAVALFALGVPFIRYAAEVKQYGLDATSTVLLLLLAVQLQQGELSARRLWLTGAAGFVVIWFSQASVIVMGGIGLAFAVEWLLTRDARTLRVLTTTIPLWAAASIVAVIAGLRSMTPSTREFMSDFWNTGFFPLPMTSLGDLRWFWTQLLSVFSDITLLRYHWPVLFLALTAIGIVVLLRTRRDTGLLLLGPLLMALVAALAQQYPFRGRLMIYLVPVFLLTIAASAEWLRSRGKRAHPALAFLLLGLVLFQPVATLATTPPPYDLERHRDVLRYLQQQRQPGDVLYAFPLSRIGMSYYGPAYGLQPDAMVTATCDRYETRPFLLDVDRFRGAPRLWVLSSGTVPYRFARATVRGYLNTIGVKRDSLILSSPNYGTISLELFDLSDPVRLAAASAQTFNAPAMATNPRPGCRPWILPDAPASLR